MSCRLFHKHFISGHKLRSELKVIFKTFFSLWKTHEHLKLHCQWFLLIILTSFGMTLRVLLNPPKKLFIIASFPLSFYFLLYFNCLPSCLFLLFRLACSLLLDSQATLFNFKMLLCNSLFLSFLLVFFLNLCCCLFGVFSFCSLPMGVIYPAVKLYVLPCLFFVLSVLLQFIFLFGQFASFSHCLSLLNVLSARHFSLKVSFYSPAKICVPSCSFHRCLASFSPPQFLSFFKKTFISLYFFSHPSLHINSMYCGICVCVCVCVCVCSWHLTPPSPCSPDKKSIISMMFLDLEEIELRNLIDFPGLGVLLPQT